MLDQMRLNFWTLVRNLKIFQWDIAILTGTERHSGEQIRMLYIGEIETPERRWGRLYNEREAAEKFHNFTFFTRLVFAEFETQRLLTDVNITNVRRHIRNSDSNLDFVVADTESLMAKLFFTTDYIRIPKWVNFTLPIKPEWRETKSQFRRNIRKNINTLRNKYRFDSEFSFSKSDIRDFYHQIYLPHTKNRFDVNALLLTEKSLTEGDGLIMKLTLDGEAMMSTFLRPSGDTLIMVAWGMDDSQNFSDVDGAFTSAILHTIRYAQDNGFRAVDFLSSKPFHVDGSFFFKRKWGSIMRAIPDASGDFRLRTCRLTPATRSFWKNNRLVVCQGQSLSGMVFHDDSVAGLADIDRAIKLWLTNGMESLYFTSSSGYDADAQKAVSKDSRLKLLELDSSNPFWHAFGADQGNS